MQCRIACSRSRENQHLRCLFFVIKLNIVLKGLALYMQMALNGNEPGNARSFVFIHFRFVLLPTSFPAVLKTAIHMFGILYFYCLKGLPGHSIYKTLSVT